MLEIYVDGASAGNPGLSGIGIFIKGEGQSLQISEAIGQSDNHTAEFIAMIRGLQEAQRLGSTFVSVRSDSKIVVASIEKRHAKHFKELVAQVLELVDSFELFFIKWVPSDQNRAADNLARQGIQKNKH
ncbi:ribonuclease HI family protein [Kurthia sibirica]|uniref:Ribonuclease HI n=1 Tax=Kurthia sibirica TaxID=202750 RepID=A0A2U3APK6_9BACL|nr:ribonuclease HI family protein [Kurthia sibirica]PWI26467.1 ribonuclease HI [Kurthia sibirica]GEK33034.1 ribonuclease H [Kurthia sibirica]